MSDNRVEGRVRYVFEGTLVAVDASAFQADLVLNNGRTIRLPLSQPQTWALLKGADNKWIRITVETRPLSERFSTPVSSEFDT